MVSPKIPAQIKIQRASTNQSVDIANRPLLGVVERADKAEAALRPTYVWRNNRWQTLPDGTPVFTWQTAPEDAGTGSLWGFIVERCDDAPASRLALAGEPLKPYEVRFHRRSSIVRGAGAVRAARAPRTLESIFDDLEAFRTHYFVKGVEPSDLPVLVSYREQFAVGPLTLEGEGERWVPNEDPAASGCCRQYQSRRPSK